ncbi:MAG TPA: hypothetical protein PLS53_09410 [Thermoanaerobaculaceae bacterium]|nr:hypothetical protein [Thermoanaerobaculaceae bacterium]HPS78361.1 hypothetical protein [Thermoanaerobaculaceae bacterium]
MKTPALTLSLPLVLLGLAVSALAQTSQNVTCDGILVTPVVAGVASDRLGARQTSVAATRADELELGIVLPRVMDHGPTYEVRLYTPNGHLYQVVPVAVGMGWEHDQTRSVAGYSQPTDVVQPRNVTVDGRKVELAGWRLPLAGSDIFLSSMYGTWTAEVWPTGAGSPCAATKFAIEP